MTPNFELFRKLYQRIAAKPEALVRLNFYKSPPNECGTPFCVLGELCEMPEAQALGFGWHPFDTESPTVGREYAGVSYPIVDFPLGITGVERISLFEMRCREDISEKSEALARIEKLFADHGEPLHLPDSIEYARRDEVVA